MNRGYIIYWTPQHSFELQSVVLVLCDDYKVTSKKSLAILIFCPFARFDCLHLLCVRRYWSYTHLIFDHLVFYLILPYGVCLCVFFLKILWI